MGKIFIVRHGQDEDNAQKILNGRRNRSLTDLGKKQVKKIAGELKSYNIQVIYSSPLKRAVQTAQIIAGESGIKDINIHEELTERDFGILTGKLIADIPKYSQKILHSNGIQYFLEAKGIESFPNLYKRARQVLQSIQKKHSDENVVIITHGDAGKMIRAAYYGWNWEEGLKQPNFENAQVVELKKLNANFD
jgi:broad specificity phosphatase PhoE